MLTSTMTPSVFAEHPCGNHDNVHKESVRICRASMWQPCYNVHNDSVRFCRASMWQTSSCALVLVCSRTGFVRTQSEKTPPYMFDTGSCFLRNLCARSPKSVGGQRCRSMRLRYVAVLALGPENLSSSPISLPVHVERLSEERRVQSLQSAPSPVPNPGIMDQSASGTLQNMLSIPNWRQRWP